VVTSAREVASTVLDPELPVLSIDELGILRDVTEDDQGRVHVQITPTYSGCPAMETIRTDLVDALTSAGYQHVSVEFVLSPAWTTDWISDEGQRKLREYGIAPPGAAALPGGAVPIRLVRRPPAAPVACPHCGSAHTDRLSAFGSTACKSLYRCLDCREPFEHFKPL
jgi:ring-1,2-phenylacetyl-CoA epoxidase subunit PaaD